MISKSALLTLITAFLLLKSDGGKTLDFGGFFTMETPDGWQYIEKRGFDSFVGEIQLQGTDIVHFDYGYYSNNLDEEFNFRSDGNDILTPVIVTGKDGRKSAKYVFYCKKDTFDKYKLARTNNYNYEMIAGKRAKIVTPKQFGSAITGIYFDSIAFDGYRNIELQISGTIQDRQNYNDFLQAVRTLKFTYKF